MTKTQCRKVWNRVLRHYGVKEICLAKWYHFVLRRSAKRLLGPLASRLDKCCMFLQIGQRKMLHVPPGYWAKNLNSAQCKDRLVLLVHELTHDEQCAGDPKRFYSNYISNKSARAVYETEALYNETWAAWAFGQWAAGEGEITKQWAKDYLVSRDFALAAYRSIDAPTKRAKRAVAFIKEWS